MCVVKNLVPVQVYSACIRLLLRMRRYTEDLESFLREAKTTSQILRYFLKKARYPCICA